MGFGVTVSVLGLELTEMWVLVGGRYLVYDLRPTVLLSENQTLIWEFPKIRDPNVVP